MFKFLVLFFMFIGTAFADPTLAITANKTDMAVNETATLTFTFSQSVTGFDVTKVIAVGGTVSAFSGSGASYTATFTKTDALEAVVQVENNSYSPTGTGNYLGFNTYKKYYKNSGSLFNSTKVEVSPQPRCPLTGETLANPTSQVKVQLFTLERTAYGNSLYYKEAKDSCLVVLQTGQYWTPKVSPTAVELANVHGIHNHSGLHPRITTQQIPSINGVDKIRVRPGNHDAKISTTNIGTSTTSNDMTVGSHTYTTNVALGLLANSRVQITNTANTAQYVRGSVTSNVGTSLVVNVTQSNAAATLTTWTIAAISRGAGGHPALDGAARFIFSSCSMGFIDPITKPGQKSGSHHHTFYGNCNINENTTTATIHNSTSSAAGGIANQTGYWAPSIIDTATGTAMNPSGIQAYYKAGTYALGSTEKLPQGLRIIMGDHTSTVAQDVNLVNYHCNYPGGATANTNYIPTCPSNATQLVETIRFPQCVQDNGSGSIVLDSTDHRSHLAGQGIPNTTGFGANGCPTGFPHLIPSISILLAYDIAKGQNTGTWRLSSDNYSLASPGGYSTHADWFMGWRDEFAQRMIDQCNNQYIDCGEQYFGLNNGIGFGTTSGVAISSVSVTGNVVTVTTSVPHQLPIDLNGTQGGLLYYGGTSNINNGYLLARVTGITGTDAAAYNFDPLDALANFTDITLGNNIYRNINSTGVQSINVIDATHFSYVTNYIPTNTTPTITTMKVQWGESLCTLSDTCLAAYYGFYYPVP